MVSFRLDAMASRIPLYRVMKFRVEFVTLDMTDGINPL